MPVYQNNTGSKITVPNNGVDIEIEDGNTINVDFFIPDEYGLTEIDDAPRVIPQTLSAGKLDMYEDDVQEIYIPVCEAFLATFVCKSGSATIKESYDDSTVEIPIDPQNAYRAAFKRRDVEAFWLTAKKDDTEIVYNVSRLSS